MSAQVINRETARQFAAVLWAMERRSQAADTFCAVVLQVARRYGAQIACTFGDAVVDELHRLDDLPHQVH